MTETTIPEDIKIFILDYIDSIAQLEALMLLKREPSMLWTPAQLAARLYIGAAEAKLVLEHLSTHRLVVEENDVYRCDCSTPATQALITRLAEVYARQLIPVTHLIHTKAANRIREFADAFRFRKDK